MLMLMRLDIKKVKDKKYIQFVDSRGHIFHIGPASDLNSWLVGMLILDKQQFEEYNEKRADFFDKIEYEIAKCISLDPTKLEAIDAIRSQDIFRYSRTQSTRLPKVSPFGEFDVNNNIKQRQWQPWKWYPNDMGKQIQERLDEIYYKQRRLARKYESSNLFTEEKLKIMDHRKMIRETALKEQNIVLSVLKEMEKKTGIVKKPALLKALAMRCKFSKEEAERILTRLLREGEIFEPKEHCFKIT
jgi:hypothetical protein